MRMVDRKVLLGNYGTLADALSLLPEGIDHKEVYIECEKEWSWGEEITEMYFVWKERESPEEQNARVARETAQKNEQKQRELETLERLKAKYEAKA